MKAVICRTGSGSTAVRTWNVPTSPRRSVSVQPLHESVVGEKNRACSSPSICLQMEMGRRNIRRVSSTPNVIRSEIELSGGAKSLSKLGSRSYPAKISEEEDNAGLLTSMANCRSYVGDWLQNAIPVEELGFPGGGIGNNWNFGGGSGGNEFSTGGSSDRNNLCSYYEQMLKSDPTNALLLRNYGKYLHEVEKDFVKAEEYYGRAILACPGDGEVLSLYGRLIWETQRDESRAKSYFDQAVKSSPDDCTVMGSYAHFMWGADEDEDEEEEGEETMVSGAVKTMVEAF